MFLCKIKSVIMSRSFAKLTIYGYSIFRSCERICKALEFSSEYKTHTETLITCSKIYIANILKKELT